jgi:Mn2+/Fe2+ NRAMP family transporter
LGGNLVAMLFQALSAKLGIVLGEKSRPIVYAMWFTAEIGASIALELMLHISLLTGIVITGRASGKAADIERQVGYSQSQCCSTSSAVTSAS